MLPQRVWFLHHFGLKTGIDFAHFDLESDMVFGGNIGVYEHIYRFSSKKVKREMCEPAMDFKKSFW